MVVSYTCLQANFSKRQLVLEAGIDTQYLFATLNDVRRVEGKSIEPCKRLLPKGVLSCWSFYYWAQPVSFCLFSVSVTGQLFEKGKEELGGLHFVALQESEESEDVQGFFLLRERKQR